MLAVLAVAGTLTMHHADLSAWDVCLAAATFAWEYLALLAPRVND